MVKGVSLNGDSPALRRRLPMQLERVERLVHELPITPARAGRGRVSSSVLLVAGIHPATEDERVDLGK